MSKTKHNTDFSAGTGAGVNGEQLAIMLAVASFSDSDKERWVQAVPSMTFEQLKRFEKILRSDLERQAVQEVEDVAMAVRAVEHKRDLSLLAIHEAAMAELDNIQAEIGT